MLSRQPKVFIPLPNADATHVLVLMRPSLPARRIPHALGDRSLSVEGHALCNDVAEEYSFVRNRVLNPRFGTASFFCAPDFMSAFTSGMIFRPLAIMEDARLSHDFSLWKINDGEWYNALRQRKLTLENALDEAWNNRDALFPDYDARMEQFHSFVFDADLVNRSRCRIAVCDDPLISFFAAEHDDCEDPHIKLGLFSCQSLFVFHNNKRVVSMYRFHPSATLARLQMVKR